MDAATNLRVVTSCAIIRQATSTMLKKVAVPVIMTPHAAFNLFTLKGTLHASPE